MRRILLTVALALLTFDAAAAMSGYVLDPDGKPVAGARIRAVALESTEAQYERFLSAAPEPVPLATAQTDDKGAFRLDTKRQPVVALLIDGPGRAFRREEVVDGDSPVFILPSATMNMKKGRVTANGKGVAGAAVIVGNGFVARTDENGEYVAPADPPRIYVVHPDFAIFESARTRDASSLDIALDAGRPFTGRVVDAGGRPVANAIVRSGNWPLAKSAEDGSFTIAHLEPKNAATLHAVIDSRLGTIKGDTIVVRPAGTVMGTVRSAKDDLPIAGMQVTVRQTTNPATFATAITDAKGAFLLQAVPAGVQLALSHPAFINASHDARVKDGERVESALTASPLGRLTGSVIDADKRPVGGVRIHFSSSASGGAVSAPDGTFAVRVPPVSVTLQARKKTYPDATYGPLRVAPGELKSGVRIVMPRGKPFEIALVDSTGAPIAGEPLVISRRNEVEDRVASTWVRCGDTGEPQLDTCRSNAEGKVSFNVGEGLYDIRAGGNATIQKELRAQNLAAETSPLTVELERGAVIEGRVVWSDGTPMTAAAHVMTSGEFTGAGTPVTNGAFVMRNVPAGKVSLIVRTMPPVFVESDPVEVTAPTSGVILKLPRLGRIEGRVVERESERPVRQFTVTAERRGSMRRTFPPKAFTADDGRFVLEDVPPGPLDVGVTAPGFVRGTTSNVEVPEGKSATVEVSLERGGTVAGRVTSSGRPVSGAQVSASERRRGQDTKQTDANGDYLIDTLPAGTHDLTVRKEGYVARTITVNVSVGKETRGDVELSRGRDVTGRVIDTAGRPVAGAEVMFHAGGGGRPSYSNMQQSDTEGMFRLEGLADEAYTVTARKSGYVEASAEITSSTPSVTLTLSRGGSLSGRVSGLPPAELSNVEVSVMSRGGSRTSAPVDVTGAFTLNGVPDGDVTVTASLLRPRHRTVQAQVKVVGGNGPFVELDFAAGLVVRGRVTLRGQPVRGMVHLVPIGNASPASAGTAQIQGGGSYEARVQTPGQYRFLVTMQNGPGTMEIETIDVRGEMEHDVEIRGGPLRARVTDAATGIPVADATVSIVPAPGRSISGSDRPVDSSGLAIFDFLVEARYTVRAQKDGYGTALQEVSVENGHGADVDLTLGRAELVLVTVIDQETGANADAFLSVVDAAGRPLTARTPQRDPGGAYRLWLAPGAYTLNVLSRTHEPAKVSLTVPAMPTVLVKLARKKG